MYQPPANKDRSPPIQPLSYVCIIPAASMFLIFSFDVPRSRTDMPLVRFQWPFSYLHFAPSKQEDVLRSQCTLWILLFMFRTPCVATHIGTYIHTHTILPIRLQPHPTGSIALSGTILPHCTNTTHTLDANAHELHLILKLIPR